MDAHTRNLIKCSDVGEGRGKYAGQISGWGNWVDKDHGERSEVLEGGNYFYFFVHVGLKCL